MKTGHVVFLNGVTSAGKTQISKAIQEMAEEQFRHLSYDMVNHFYWDMFYDKHYKQIEASGRVYEYWAESVVLTYRLARMMAEQGNNVILDGALEERDVFIECYQKTNYELLLDVFSGLNIFMVEVFCPLDECRRRNIARGDRGETQSDEQNEMMNKTIRYNYSVNTLADSPELCAEKIRKELYLQTRKLGE